jgi:hypothetical protein
MRCQMSRREIFFSMLDRDVFLVKWFFVTSQWPRKYFNVCAFEGNVWIMATLILNSISWDSLSIKKEKLWIFFREIFTWFFHSRKVRKIRESTYGDDQTLLISLPGFSFSFYNKTVARGFKSNSQNVLFIIVFYFFPYTSLIDHWLLAL